MLEQVCPDISAVILPDADWSPENAAQASSELLYFIYVNDRAGCQVNSQPSPLKDEVPL